MTALALQRRYEPIRSRTGHSPAGSGRSRNSPDRTQHSGGPHNGDAHTAACNRAAYCNIARTAYTRAGRVGSQDRFGSARRYWQAACPMQYSS